MQAGGSLQTLAEVSVALAGFASLLLVLRRGSAASVSQGEGADLFVVVGGNLLVLLFSLIPIPLFYFGVSESAVWRSASGLFAGALVLGYLAILRVRASLLASGVESLFPRVSRVTVHTPLIVVTLLVVSSLGLFGSSVVGAYLLALVLLVLLSSLPLLFLVVELATAPRPKFDERAD
jgi:hypothetical protein